MESEFNDEPRFNRLAAELVAEGSYAEAEALLEAAVQSMPTGWKPEQNDGRHLTVAFWDQEEFLAYVRNHPHPEQSIFWVDKSYSRAWYLQAVAASKQGQYERALFCVDCGLELEPDHPELWNEKGYLLARLKRHQEALDCYLRAASVRVWAPRAQVARALRGEGVQLVDLDRLEEAETVLRKSLELEPDSEVAKKELDYIKTLKSRRQEVPRFVRVWKNPPTDPVTIRLLTLTEGLPSIPGPKTVGEEN